MGHHYIPQHHLRGFASFSDRHKIWMYDKEQQKFRLLPIKKVAQKPDFYSEEDEKFLSEKIEGPVQYILKKMKTASHDISLEEKILLSIYIISMMLRIPKHREFLEKNFIPNEYKNFISDPEKLATELDMTVEEVKIEAEEYERNVLESESRNLARIDQLAVIRCKYKEIGEKYLSRMNWAIIQSNSSYKFLTSDNPVFTSENSVLSNSNPETILPLTSSCVLHISSHNTDDNRNITYVKGSSEVIKQINNRTVWRSDRFLFYHVKVPWIEKLVQNMSDKKLHPIVWTRQGPKLDQKLS